MNPLPRCPQCSSELTYEDGRMYVCPDCAHEWSIGEDGKDTSAHSSAANESAAVARDANGNVLQDGDTVTMIKDLKVKGSSSVLKIGTKVKGVRIVAGDHNIDCRIEGFGAMKLKSEFVKKA